MDHKKENNKQAFKQISPVRIISCYDLIKKKAKNGEVYLLFVDLTKAYDTTPLNKL